MYPDLDDFLADLDKRKLLARVAEPVSPDLEIAAVTDRACKSPGGGPALLFEKPAGFDIPVATNVYGSMERMCLALGVKTLDDLAREIDELMTPQMPEGHHGRAEDAADGRPAARPDAEDREGRAVPGDRQRATARSTSCPSSPAGPRTAGRTSRFRWCSRRIPETGERNIGTYRMQVFDGRTTGMHWQRHKGGAQHHRVAERLGKRLEVAVALSARAGAAVLRDGADARRPRRAAARRIPLARRRIELVKCVTVDLEVPASSHIVLEGYVEPGERRREGPFGDHTGPLFAARRLSGVPSDVRHAPQAADLSHDRRRRAADGGLLPRAGERADLPADDPEDAAGDRRHAFPGRGHLPQPRPRLDRQALSRPRAQDHERVLGPRPADVLEDDHRRRQGRERAGRAARSRGSSARTWIRCATSR